MVLLAVVQFSNSCVVLHMKGRILSFPSVDTEAQGMRVCFHVWFDPKDCMSSRTWMAAAIAILRGLKSISTLNIYKNIRVPPPDVTRAFSNHFLTLVTKWTQKGLRIKSSVKEDQKGKQTRLTNGGRELFLFRVIRSIPVFSCFLPNNFTLRFPLPILMLLNNLLAIL